MTKPPRKVVVTQKFFDDEAVAFLRGNDIEVEIATLPVPPSSTWRASSMLALLYTKRALLSSSPSRTRSRA